MGERSSFSKLLFLLGATIGALFGMGFAQRKGEELRAQLKKSLQQGKSPAKAIAQDLLAAGKEVVGALERLGESESLGELKKNITIQTKKLGEAARQHLTDLSKQSSHHLRAATKRAHRAAKKVAKHVVKKVAKKISGKKRAKKTRVAKSAKSK